MTCWVIIPVKAPEACKTRLRGALGEDARRALVADMLRHVVGVAAAAPGVDRVLVLGPSRHGLPAETALMADPGGGLNAALSAAAASAAGAGVSRLAIVAADLPRLTPQDLQALIEAPEDQVVIAPDRAGVGTNALSLPLPGGRGFAFRYGPGSFTAHAAEAARLGLGVREARSPTLALDIDEPQDLAALAGS